jgi:hypothetical protein
VGDGGVGEVVEGTSTGRVGVSGRVEGAASGEVSMGCWAGVLSGIDVGCGGVVVALVVVVVASRCLSLSR